MFFLVFKMWKKGIETEIELQLSILRIVSKNKYVSLILKKFCKEKRIIMEFTSPNIPKQNSIAKWSWHILDIIKDAIFIDNKLFKEF